MLKEKGGRDERGQAELVKSIHDAQTKTWKQTKHKIMIPTNFSSQ